jgi:hypothetical protein
LQIPNLEGALSQMDDVDPDNLANLQTVATNYVSSNSSLLDEICAILKEGRGSNMPGIGSSRS